MRGKKSVMLVDDDVDFVAMNRAFLEKNRYKVIVAYSGKQCLEALRHRRPDAIILDLMMNTISEGFEVSRELRNSERTKHIPLIMLTSANSALPIRVQPDETWLPVDVFLEKPVDPDLLLEVLWNTTGGKTDTQK